MLIYLVYQGNACRARVRGSNPTIVSENCGNEKDLAKVFCLGHQGYIIALLRYCSNCLGVAANG